MKRLWFVGAGVGAAAIAFLVVADTPEPEAADHLDSPSVEGTPLTDITDLYAWMNGDADQLNLVMAVHPGFDPENDTAFDDAATYRFNIVSSDGTDTEEHTVDCTADDQTPQNVTCVLDEGIINLNNEHIVPVDSVEDRPNNGLIRAFAGVRNDPFFFNLDGFVATAAAVNDAAGDLSFNDDGCPTLTDGTAEALVNCLSTDCANGPGDSGNGAAEDAFAGSSVLAIVVSVDKAALGVGENDATTFSVWASTLDDQENQIDRVGRPAISTALIDPFDLDPDHDQLKNDYNTDDDPTNWASAFQDTIEANLAILDALDSTGPQ